jgi:hypothetical protein
MPYLKLIKMVELENHDSLIQPAACGQGIYGLNLVELRVNNDKKLFNVSFMKNLKILHANGSDCGINQNGINGLNLVELRINYNSKIFDVSFMKKLKILDAGCNHNIDQNG